MSNQLSESLATRFGDALKAHRAGRLREAEAGYRAVLAGAPEYGPALVNLGGVLRGMGHGSDALGYFRAATELPDAPPEAWCNLGNAELDEGEFAAAEASYRRALAIAPQLAPAHLQLARSLRGQDRLAESALSFEAAIAVAPDLAAAWLELGNVQRSLHRESAALASYQRVLALEPKGWKAHYSLARLAEERDDPEAFAAHWQRALALAPQPGEPWLTLAQARLDGGRAQAAEAAFRAALEARPDRLLAAIGLGQCLMRLGRDDEALPVFQRVTASDDALLLTRLAAAVWEFNLWQLAVAALQKAVRLQPANARTHFNLAEAHLRAWQLDEALACCDAALAREPGAGEAVALRAAVCVKQGDIESALAGYQRVYELTGSRGQAPSSLAFGSLYSDRLSPVEVADLHRELTRAWVERLQRPRVFANDRDPERRLRIGYVSADLHRQHPVDIFMQPVLAAHDRDAFDIHVYYSSDAYDTHTRRARERVECWHDVAGWPDERLCEQILGDRIDLLVDLSGHTGHHRLRVFAMRAAPVQATLLGYPHSTGLATMDYLIADPVVCPPEADPLCSERVERLPDCIFCYAPDHDYPPVDIAAHRERSDPVLGSFNNVPKLTPRTVRLWSAVLAALPRARLLLKAPSFQDRGARERYLRLFAEQGVARQRIELRGPSELGRMMAEYNDIDIGLDPTPFNGGTTTFQALWMGVPVVTLAGGNFCQRMGASILGGIDLPELIAQSNAEYVTIVTALAADRERLAALKQGLRARLADSALGDPPRYTRNLEAAYRRMWRRYAAADQGHMPD